MTSTHYLLDAHLLVAWGWADHADHDRAVSWIAAQKQNRGAKLFTAAIPEIGFVRVAVQRSNGRIPAAEAADVLRGMLDSLGPLHEFLPDDLGGTKWPAWCTTASRATDAHLLELAHRHGLALATLDVGIPGALLLP